jgi:hypothetical protein
MVCNNLKTFADDWRATIKQNITKKIADLELKGEFSDLERALSSSIRYLGSDISNLPSRSNYTNPTESLERAIQNTEVPRHSLLRPIFQINRLI